MADQNSINAEESDYLYVKKSQLDNSGNGLFTAIAIYKDEIIAVFKGEILPKEQINSIITAGNDRYFMDLPNGNTLDCMHTEGFAKYANDASGLSKSMFRNNAQITLDENENVCLVALRNISSGEELFCDYGNRTGKNAVRPIP